MNESAAFDYDKEVRLALVMYGGVSLAIYINGVCQELFRLVRASAPGSPPDRSPSPSELVYRKVSWLQARPGRTLSDLPAEGFTPATRYVIDIISGTSAGGINGIFLAKALANGEEMGDLQRLWVREGEISLLINDRKSKEKGIPLRDPPESLLNSQRMYAKLLDAFSDMDRRPDRTMSTPGPSPYVDELDLFVTATDLQGIALPLRLADRVVFERRHRNSFHFAYCATESPQEPRNDFVWQNNPFLAFAARCTSAFPFAFEPMKLSDIDFALSREPQYHASEFRSDSPLWKKFYPDYENLPAQVRSRVPFPERSFGDGGYLDNKPFSYSIETLANRQADVPVDRKLIYIEPSPEHPELDPGSAERPDVLHNVTACLLTLPRYETIRSDLQRVLERNRLLARVGRINEGVERDLETEYPWLDDETWRKMDLVQLGKRGRGYLAYHRLLISAVTDNLAETVTRVMGFDEKSDDAVAIRCLVRAWRDAGYSDRHDGTGRESLTAFLLWYDLGYPLRQLAFLREKIDRAFTREPSDNQHLRRIKSRVNDSWRKLRNLRQRLRSRTESPLRTLLDDINVSHEDLHWVLGEKEPPSRTGTPSGAEETERAELFLDQCERRAATLLKRECPGGTVKDRLDQVAKTVRALIEEAVSEADASCRAALELQEMPANPRALEGGSLAYYYLNFDLFDMVTFPILYQTGIGEVDNIEVLRVSPEDATLLIDEQETRCSKLAGTSLWHFGAFMEKRWRVNDILWGRLDGAERLIKAMLPGHPDARRLIGEAHAAIMIETLAPLGEEERYDLLAESLMRPASGAADPDPLLRFVGEVKRFAGPAERGELDRLLDEARLRDHYCRNFKQQKRLPAEETLRSAARATTVVGRMLEGLTDKYGVGKKYAVIAVRLGRVFWGLVEVSVPQSLANLVFRHWLFLLYFVEIAIIVDGLVFDSPAVKSAGWKALLLTALIDLLVLIFNYLMGGRLRSRRMIRRGAGLLLLVFVLYAVLSEVREIGKGLNETTSFWQRLACGTFGCRENAPRQPEKQP